jgi:hypothetical protein
MLDDHLEATLGRRQMRDVALHLRSCPACSALFEELRVIDALLTTTQPRGRIGSDFTAAVISAAAAAPPHPRRRMALWVPLLAYLCVAWTLLAVAALDGHGVGLFERLAAWGDRGLAAVEAGLWAVAPETAVAAAVVTAVLLVDLLLLAGLFYGYRRLRPILSIHLARGSRS